VSQADDREPLLAPEEEAELLGQLEAALRPGQLDAATHERLLALALEDPLAPPSEQELVESARLRDALATGAAHSDADVLRALAAPFGEPSAASVESALQAALGASAPPAPPRRNVVYAVFGGASALLAAAAAVALLVTGASEKAAPMTAPAAVAVAPALVKPHSTADLFDERFETAGTTARMDVIASARSRDLRDNRYAAWGVP
jgi:hypothetical protein